MAFSVQLRTRELGIRLAIGDTPAGIRRRIVREGLKLTALGLGLAALGSYWIRNAVGAFVVADSTPASSAVLAVVITIVGIVSVAAFVIPARRAARIFVGHRASGLGAGSVAIHAERALDAHQTEAAKLAEHSNLLRPRGRLHDRRDGRGHACSLAAAASRARTAPDVAATTSALDTSAARAVRQEHPEE